MNDILNNEAYLFISSKKLIISVNSELNEKVYFEESSIESDFRQNNFEKLDLFLNQNIYKIEKKFQNFIENVTIILDLDIFFHVEISVKKNDFNDFINIKDLNYLLYEAKESCKKTIDTKKIIHMLVKNYQVDNESYSFFPKDIKCHSYSLDLKLICIPDSSIRELETILKKYSISLKQIVSAEYIKEFFTTEDNDIFSVTKKITSGHNPNEVEMIDKISKKQGFFTKFFDFFS